MPVVKHGFAFKYFDKIVCGVVGLGVIAAIVFALSRANSASRDAPTGSVESALSTLQRELAAKHVDPQPKPYAAQIRRRLTEVRAPRTVAPIIYPPLPIRYLALAISTNREFVLEFNAPLNKDSVTVSGEAGLVTLREHPVGGDYKRVRLASGARQGAVTVEGASSEGVRHIYPVTVDAQAGKTAYRPDKVEVISKQARAVVLSIQRSARNEYEGVKVVEYEVWRRDWEDPLGDYRKVAAVSREELSLATGGLPTPVPAFGRVGMQAAAEEAIYWEDSGVTPGAGYGYKVRTVGANTYPAASDFTEVVQVEVDPEVDFRFSRSTADKVGCEVLKVLPGGTLNTETFWVGVGQEIGGVVKNQLTGEDVSYLTGATLLDFHRSVFLAGTVTDRMVYADREGHLRQRLRRETRTDLWEKADAALRPGVGRMGGGALPGGRGSPADLGPLPRPRR